MAGTPVTTDLITSGQQQLRSLSILEESRPKFQQKLPETVKDPSDSFSPEGLSDLQVIQDGSMSFTGVNFDVQIQFLQSKMNSVGAVFKDNVPRIYSLVGVTSVSVNTYREFVAVRPLGFTRAAGFGKGARTVAGTLVVTILQNSPFKTIKVINQETRSVGEHNLVSDSLPPFNLILTGINEFGQSAYMIAHGVRITTSGQTISVYDRLTEEAFEFVAEDLTPLTPMSPNRGIDDSTAEDLARLTDPLTYGAINNSLGPTVGDTGKTIAELTDEFNKLVGKVIVRKDGPPVLPPTNAASSDRLTIRPASSTVIPIG